VRLLQQLLPLGLAQATPDPVRLLDGEGVLTALLDDRAASAQSLGGFLAALAAHAPLGLG
jgi:hypothetical protein